jgi:hypothetical protein
MGGSAPGAINTQHHRNPVRCSYCARGCRPRSYKCECFDEHSFEICSCVCGALGSSAWPPVPPCVRSIVSSLHRTADADSKPDLNGIWQSLTTAGGRSYTQRSRARILNW